jgi:hypothetical protein
LVCIYINLKLYLVLFTIAASTILLLNSGAVAQVKAVEHIIWKYDGNNFVKAPILADHVAVGNKDNVWGVVAPTR